MPGSPCCLRCPCARRTGLSWYQAVRPSICFDGYICLPCRDRVTPDGDLTKADGRHLKEVSRKPAEEYLEPLFIQFQEAPASVGKGFPERLFLGMPEISILWLWVEQEPGAMI